MKAKYIEEIVGFWYLFPEGDITSDIATSRTCDDVAYGIATHQAKDLIEEHNRVVGALIKVILEDTPKDQVTSKLRELLNDQ